MGRRFASNVTKYAALCHLRAACCRRACVCVCVRMRAWARLIKVRLEVLMRAHHLADPTKRWAPNAIKPSPHESPVSSSPVMTAAPTPIPGTESGEDSPNTDEGALPESIQV